MTRRATASISLQRGRWHHGATTELLEEFEGWPIGYAGENHRGRKEGEKTIGLCAPASASLTEVLQTREGDDALASTLTDHARETRQWRHVGEFVEGEQ